MCEGEEFTVSSQAITVNQMSISYWYLFRFLKFVTVIRTVLMAQMKCVVLNVLPVILLEDLP